MHANTRNTAARSARSRRAFTLLEVLMAATLGVIVASACIGLFAAIQRADAKSRERTASIQAMSQLHRTLQRTMRTVLLDLPKSRPAGTPEPTEAPETRVSLGESSDGMQTLEVTLSQPPILGLVAGRPADPVARYLPVKGIFEMRRHVTRTGEPGPIELWWTPYKTGIDEPNTDAQVMVADSIESMSIRFAKTNDQKQLEKMRTAAFSDWSQIPAYVEVQVTTIDGTSAQWMFEVSGSTGMEPGQNQADADLPPAVAERYRSIAAASASSGKGPGGEASGGTNSSGASTGRTESSGGTNGSKPSGGISSSGSGSSSSGGSASSGGTSGSTSGSTSGGTTGGGSAGGSTNPLLGMSIDQLIAEFYRRLAERDGNTGG